MNVKCPCCGLKGSATHLVSCEGYAGQGCGECARLAVKLGGRAKRCFPRRMVADSAQAEQGQKGKR